MLLFVVFKNWIGSDCLNEKSYFFYISAYINFLSRCITMWWHSIHKTKFYFWIHPFLRTQIRLHINIPIGLAVSPIVKSLLSGGWTFDVSFLSLASDTSHMCLKEYAEYSCCEQRSHIWEGRPSFSLICGQNRNTIINFSVQT